jgi:hypothetical protein
MQLSCRSFYSPELEFGRRIERGVPLQLVHSNRHSEQYGTSDILTSRMSPPSDCESKSGGQPRKRVPVAVGLQGSRMLFHSVVDQHPPVRQVPETKD